MSESLLLLFLAALLEDLRRASLPLHHQHSFDQNCGPLKRRALPTFSASITCQFSDDYFSAYTIVSSKLRHSMSVASPMPSTLPSALSSDSQADRWLGANTPSSSRNVKPPTSSERKVKRKPVPTIPVELLQHQPTLCSTESSATPVLAERSLNSESSITAPLNPKPSANAITGSKTTQQPQRQYLLDIDHPTASTSTLTSVDDPVKRLLRSASVSIGSTRPRRGPLKWMQDKEEHTATASSSAPPPARQPLGRKGSILKVSLRRTKPEEPPSAPLTISAPTDFVHVSTGADEAPTTLRRPSVTSTVPSLRMSTASTSSGTSIDTTDDKPLYTLGATQPLRPLKSIRRPSRPIEEEPLFTSAGSTSPQDKRKGIYAGPGSMLDPLALSSRRARGRRRASDESEPELTKSSASGDDSDDSRSSLGSLYEFRRFLDFGEDTRPKGAEGDWTAGLALPIVLEKF